MIKIAHLQLLPILSGVQRVTLDELIRLPSEKYERYVLCSCRGPLTELAESYGIRCVVIPQLVRNISPINDFISIFRLYFFFRHHRFDIVHTHSSKTGVLGRVAARLAGVSLVVHTVHGYAFPAAKNSMQRFIFTQMERIGALFGHKVICLHDDDRTIAIEKLGCRDGDVLVIPNGVDVDFYSPTSQDERERAKLSLGMPAGSFLCGMVGRLWPQKNPFHFLNAALDLLARNVDAYFLFVGDGEQREPLETLAKQRGASDRVIFLGWRDDVAFIQKCLDVFVLPSLWEGMPLAIIEAMASGTPCVVSDIQGNRHLIQNEVTGLLVSTDDSSQLADAIYRLYSDPVLRLRLASAACEWAQSRANIEVRISIIRELYEGQVS